ncbi:MAG: DUF6108 family protein [Bacteroidales bacterium]|nr:DUF6108 family protein [Bacteroidales bacterium]
MMKRLLTIFAAMLLCAAASAQEGLYVEDLFEGNVISRKIMKRTFISGAQLRPYKLDTYKSLTFTVDEGAMHEVEVRVIRDAYDAPDKQMDYDGGHLTYALVCLPPLPNGLNRFLCYQAKEIKGLWDVTVVYLRGRASVEDLNLMFNKKER